jgi:NTE family protein
MCFDARSARYRREQMAPTNRSSTPEGVGSAKPRKDGRDRADQPRMGTRLPFPGSTRTRTGNGAARPRTAFVLSGGGNQGVSQVGMLRALLERDIVPDVVVGTSAGALNGAGVAYAPNLTGVAQLAAVWEQLRTEDIFPGGKFHRAWNVMRRETHLFDNTGLSALIHRATPARAFADLETPLRVIATDLDSGDEVVFARGPLQPALLASTALPGVFPIVEHDGRRLVDGGVVNGVPLWHALSGPVDRVYILNVSAGVPDRVERSALDVVMTSFMHARSQRFELELRHVPANVEVVVLPRPRDERDVFDFSGARELIDEAYELTCQDLERRRANPTAVMTMAERIRRFRARRGA